MERRHHATITRRTISSSSTTTSTTLDRTMSGSSDERLVVKRSSMERSSSDELQAMERSRTRTVLWRSETSFSDDDDNDISSAVEERPLLVIQPDSAAGEALRVRNEQLLVDVVVPFEQQTSYTIDAIDDDKKRGKKEIYVEVDLEKYMSDREMTPIQERVNALTMIPPPIFCLCFVLSGNWISKQLLADAIKTLEQQQQQDMSHEALSEAFDNNSTCFDWSNTPGLGWLFRHIYALPPLPVLAIVLGVVAHAPFSFLYHWTYAHVLSPSKRTDHWSRRMDQSMIHVSSALSSFGTSGYWDYFLVTVIYNADCIYRQFQPQVRPRRNQARLGAAIVAWMIPIVRRGEWDMFLQVFATLAIGSFLFVRYPIGGWSHAAFHLTLLPLMPLLMEVATNLPTSQETLQGAAQCFALAELRHNFS